VLCHWTQILFYKKPQEGEVIKTKDKLAKGYASYWSIGYAAAAHPTCLRRLTRSLATSSEFQELCMGQCKGRYYVTKKDLRSWYHIILATDDPNGS